MARAATTKISSVSDLTVSLRSVNAKPTDLVWFRGQLDSTWTLLPNILRPNRRVEMEGVYLKQFKQYASPFIPKLPSTEWEWLFLMQHYGLPTRLLDWTESPLVALYFAVSDKAHDAKDAALWSLWPLRLNAISNSILTPEVELPCFGHEQDDAILSPYLPSRTAGVQSSALHPIAIIAARDFQRLHAQHGVFTLFQRNNTPIDSLTPKDTTAPHVQRFIIPAASKSQIREELSFLRIDELAIFPELSRVLSRMQIN